MNPYPVTIRLRIFWSRVIRDPKGCWWWIGAYDKDGYGTFPGQIQFGQTRAHRISYSLLIGEIPPNRSVLHNCDNPACCNPDHLFLGTPMDNMRDMITKGRQKIPRGSEQGTAKLTESVIAEIRQRYENGRRRHNHPDNQRNLAKAYGVDQAQISRIITSRAWNHV